MNTPKIRFKGFTDDWEQRKLNEIADVRDGTHDSPKYVQEGHPFITSKNVSNGFINYDEVQYITDVDYEEINKRSKVDVHDILMGMIGTIGNLALIRQKPDFAIKNVALIKYTGDVDYQYLYQTLQVDCVTRQLFTGMDGGTQKFVSLKKIRELGIPFTEEQEQQKIGQYFENLDNLITLHQRKCDETKQLKKFMLQKMFPKNGEKNPEIRFEGFTDDWEQRKLGEIVLRESLARESTIDLPYVEYEDVIAEEGRINKDIRKKEGIKKGIFFDGSQVLYGKLRPYLHNWLNPDFSGVAVGDWWVLKPNNVDKNFIYRLIQTQQFDDIANQSTGSKMPRADWNLVSNTEFAIPTSQVEQTKIGGYFSTLDNLITLHQRKCEKLKELKKFMLQNMFV